MNLKQKMMNFSIVRLHHTSVAVTFADPLELSQRSCFINLFHAVIIIDSTPFSCVNYFILFAR